MQWNIAFLCSVLWLILICFSPVWPSTVRRSQCRHDRYTQILQETKSTYRICDPSYSQTCSSGFYRETVGPNRGQCVPCSCNGLSTQCDAYTGNCMNCKFGTSGDHCERCKDGYYGNAANGTCRACPCPFTWNNFARACMDIGSGVIECLCKQGHSGLRCQRCAFGYFGNPMVAGGSCRPCRCKNSTLNKCDPLTGECVLTGESSSDDQCPGTDSCILDLQDKLEKMEDGLARVKLQLLNSTITFAPLTRLKKLEVDLSQTKIPVGSINTAVGTQVEQLEVDLDVVRDDLSLLIDEELKSMSELKRVLHKTNRTKLKAEDLLSEAAALIAAQRDLVEQLTEVKPREAITPSEGNKARMTEETQDMVQEMTSRGCSTQRDEADREQKKAQSLLDVIPENSFPVEPTQTVLDLRELSELLSHAEDQVSKSKDLNLWSGPALQRVEGLYTRLERTQSALFLATNDTRVLLKNISDIFSKLKEMKEELETHGALLDSAKQKGIEKLNSILKMMTKVDTVTEAEEHAEELNREAAEFQQVFHNVSSSLIGAGGLGTSANIVNTIEKAETVANQTREATAQTSKDVKEEDLVIWADKLKGNSTQLWMEANATQSDHKPASERVNARGDRVKELKEKGQSLRKGSSNISNDVKKIKRDGTEVLINSAKTAAAASNSAVNKITERLRNISWDLERIANSSQSADEMLGDAHQAVENLNRALPTLKEKISQVDGLSRKTPPSANMSESISSIKDLIAETRNYVNRLSLATTFNGKGHVELHPPRSIEDLKAFTVVDLLLNRHPNNPSASGRRRRRRQDRHKNANSFVFYLGNKNASGDYIGMAITSNLLVCVYKLGGIVNEVVTSQITTTSVNSSDFDRVIFHRVYQDSKVDITRSFTSQKPISFSTDHLLPHSMTGVLELDADSAVFYVGGYPDGFKPPVELEYPKYKGAMKLSYINDNPVCLFNYKRAFKMDSKQPAVKIPRSETSDSDYYDGTGYRMVLIKEPGREETLILKFHIRSRETNALLFYMGNEESFLCVFVARGFLVLRGQHSDQQLRLQSAEKVSLFEQDFTISFKDKLTVQSGKKETVSIDHIQANYASYYVGGLPELLRQRHNITAPPLRGCVGHLTENDEAVEYNRTVGVTDGCPFSLLGVRSATLRSALPADSLFDWGEQPLRFSLGFRSTRKDGTLLWSSSQRSPSVHDLRLSLVDGFAVFNSGNFTLRSDKRYSDGAWHFLSAERRPTGLELSIDNVKVTRGQLLHNNPLVPNPGENFTGCISNLYIWRPVQSFIPADLSSLPLRGEVDFGVCNLHLLPHAEVLPEPTSKTPQREDPVQVPAGTRCRHSQRDEYQLYQEGSWLSYKVPQEDLNHRPHFSLDIKTNSSKGLILHVAGRGDIPLLALYVANGKIRMSLGHGRIIQHKKQSNDGNWHKVELSVERSTFHLLVDGFRVTDGHLPNDEGSSLDLHNPVYLGADWNGKNIKGHNVPTNSVIGCIRNFKMNAEAIGEPDASHKVSPCVDRYTEEGTYFGGGHIVLDNFLSVDSQFVLELELRPQRLTGLVFHVQSPRTGFSVFLAETKVGVEVTSGKKVVDVFVPVPLKRLCDGKFHTVTVSKQTKVIQLTVDSDSKEASFPSLSHFTSLESLHIGGTMRQNQVPVSSPFVGCLRNVKLNGTHVPIQTASTSFGPVSVNGCPAD